MLLNKPNHCISLRRSMLRSFNPMSNAVTSSSLCGVPFYLNHTNAKDHNMLLNKPNHCISLRRSMLRSFNPMSNAVTSSSLCGVPFYLNHTNTRRARCAPNKHYEIPFVRGMPCSSLCPIQLIMPQGYIAKQVPSQKAPQK